MVDLSGRVLEYDGRVCAAWADELGEDFEFAAPMGEESWGENNVWRLWEFPGMRKHKSSSGRLKRFCKAFEGLVNYAKIWFHLGRGWDIVHFQWVPFTEFSRLDEWALPLLKRRSKGARWVLTQHNVYPHNCRDKAGYRRRMTKVARTFDAFVLHNESAKRSFCEEFAVAEAKVRAIQFGCYWETPSVTSAGKTGKYRILHFGSLSPYKGSDLLVEAFARLGGDMAGKAELRLVGRASDAYATKLKRLDNGAGVVFNFGFASREALEAELQAADLVVLPYREIGQSAVLLLAFLFDVDLLVSDLGAFLDTMTGAPPDCFFKSGDVESLASHLKAKIDRGRGNWLKGCLEEWRKVYRWDTMARKTIDLYRTLVNTPRKSPNNP